MDFITVHSSYDGKPIHFNPGKIIYIEPVKTEFGKPESVIFFGPGDGQYLKVKESPAILMFDLKNIKNR